MTRAIKQQEKTKAKEQERTQGSPGGAQASYHEMEPRLVPLGLIDDNPQGFERPDNGALLEHVKTLAASIRAMRESGARPYGLIHYPTARKSDGRYQLADGGCRRRAYVLLLEETKDERWSRLPVMVSALSDQQMGDIAWRENHDRQDIDPITMARFYQKQLEISHITQEALASRLGTTQSAIAHALRLLDLPEPVVEMVKDGQLTARHGRELLALSKKPDLLVKVAEEATQKALSVEETSRLAGNKLRQTARSLDKHSWPRPVFDTKECGKCESCVEAADYNGRAEYCTDIKCWDKKQKEAEAKANADREKKIQEVIKSQGEKTIDLSKMKFDDYASLGLHDFERMDKPEECQGCEHKVKGVDPRGGDVIDVCLKPKCQRQKEKLYRDAENRKRNEGQEKLKTKFDEVLANLGTRSPLNVHSILCMVASLIIGDDCGGGGRNEEDWAPEYGLTPRPDAWPQPPLDGMFKELRPADIVRIIVRESFLCLPEDERRLHLRLIKEDLRLPLSIEDEPNQERGGMMGMVDVETPRPSIDAPWYAMTVFEKSHPGKGQPACWGEFGEEGLCMNGNKCNFRNECSLLKDCPLQPVEAEALKDLGIRLARHVHHATTCQGCELGPTDHTMEWHWPQPVCLKDVAAAASQALRKQDLKFQEAVAHEKKTRGKGK